MQADRYPITMPELELDALALQKLQIILRRAHDEGLVDADPGCAIPDGTDYIEQQLAERYESGEFNEYKELDGRIPANYVVEDLGHFQAEYEVMHLTEACPICGDTDCDRGVAYIGANPIHADQHPEAKAERAMDNRAPY